MDYWQEWKFIQIKQNNCFLKHSHWYWKLLRVPSLEKGLARMQEIWQESDNDMTRMRRWQQTWKNRRRIVFLLSNRKSPEDERIKIQKSNKNHRWWDLRKFAYGRSIWHFQPPCSNWRTKTWFNLVTLVVDHISHNIYLILLKNNTDCPFPGLITYLGSQTPEDLSGYNLSHPVSTKLK